MICILRTTHICCTFLCMIMKFACLAHGYKTYIPLQGEISRGPNVNPLQSNATLATQHGLCGPNASQWNIVCIWDSRLGFEFGICVGHLDFMLFVSISFVLGSQCKRNYWYVIYKGTKGGTLRLCWEAFLVDMIFFQKCISEIGNTVNDVWC